MFRLLVSVAFWQVTGDRLPFGSSRRAPRQGTSHGRASGNGLVRQGFKLDGDGRGAGKHREFHVPASLTSEQVPLSWEFSVRWGRGYSVWFFC